MVLTLGRCKLLATTWKVTPIYLHAPALRIFSPHPYHSFFGEGKDKILEKLVFSKETSVDGVLRTSFGIF